MRILYNCVKNLCPPFIMFILRVWLCWAVPFQQGSHVPEIPLGTRGRCDVDSTCPVGYIASFLVSCLPGDAGPTNKSQTCQCIVSSGISTKATLCPRARLYIGRTPARDQWVLVNLCRIKIAQKILQKTLSIHSHLKRYCKRDLLNGNSVRVKH